MAEGFADSQGRPCCLMSISPADQGAVGTVQFFQGCGRQSIALTLKGGRKYFLNREVELVYHTSPAGSSAAGGSPPSGGSAGLFGNGTTSRTAETGRDR